MKSAYEILACILHDNDAEIHRTAPGGYADGMAASGARIRAWMVGLPRSAGGRGPGWHGNGYDPKDPTPKPPDPTPQSKVIEAEYSLVNDEHALAGIRQDLPRQHQLTNRNPSD